MGQLSIRQESQELDTGRSEQESKAIEDSAHDLSDTFKD